MLEANSRMEPEIPTKDLDDLDAPDSNYLSDSWQIVKGSLSQQLTICHFQPCS